MRNLIVPAALVTVLSLTASAVAAPSLAASSSSTETPSRTPSALGSTEIDCDRFGSEVSALIDTEISSPKISAARAAFELGVADCMFGRDDHAIKHYQQVQNLLRPDRPTAAISTPTRTQPDQQTVSAETSGPVSSLGMTLKQVTDAEHDRLGVVSSINGVMVEQVDPDSRAWQSGVRAGDIIVRLGIDEVTTPLQAMEAIRTAQLENKEQIPLVVLRDGKTHYLGLQ